MSKDACFFIVMLSIAFYAGRIWAHGEIANECEKLGGFYIGKKIFRCTKIEKPKPEEPSAVPPA